MKDDKLLHKWVNGQLSAEEKAAFAQRPEYASLEALQKGMDRLSAPPLQEEEMLAHILATPKGQIRTSRMRRLLPYAAAAAVLLLVSFFFFRAPSSSVYNTGLAEQLAQELPDGSTVNLNADSQIEFQVNDWSEDRSVILRGEAFFAVQPGSTFTVNTTEGAIRVIGTSFNVVSRSGTLEVSCYSGSVMIDFITNQLRRELQAGEAIRFTPQGDPQTWNLDATLPRATWLEGITRLRAVPLGYTVAELERQFGVQFKTNNVDLTKVVTVNFQHQKLEQALLTVFRPLSIRYEIKANQQVHLFQE